MVTHKLVKINSSTVNSPSYLVPVSEENKIEIKKATRKAKPVAEDAVTEPQPEALSEEELEEAEGVEE